MGSACEGWGRRVRELKRQMGLIKWNIIFMWLNMILLLQWSVKQIWWNSEHSMYNLMHSWTWQWWLFLLLFVINWHQKTHVYQECTDKVYRLISFVAVILQRKATIFTLKSIFWIDKSVKYIFGQNALILNNLSKIHKIDVLLLVHWSSCTTVGGIIYAITYVKILHVFITLKAKK